MTWWTNHQEKLVRDRYPTEGAEHLAKELGRTRRSVVRKANSLGIPYNRPEYGPPNEVVSRLKEERIKLGMTRKDMEAVMGVSDTAVWSWETGDHQPRLATVIEWAEFFDLELTLKRVSNKWES